MSTMIKFELKELRKLVNDKHSCVHERKVTQNMALQPWCLGNLKESLKNLMDYKIGKFDKETNGILLSYKNLRVLQNIGTIKNDNADIHFQVQADYFIFQPHVGATLKGVVNKKSITHLAVLVHRVFNVVIPRPTEEPGHLWAGSDIQEGQEVVLRIAVLDLFGALPYIRGELDERWLKLRSDTDDVEPRLLHEHGPYVHFDKTKPALNKLSAGDNNIESSPSPSPIPGSKSKSSVTKKAKQTESPNKDQKLQKNDPPQPTSVEKSKNKRLSSKRQSLVNK